MPVEVCMLVSNDSRLIFACICIVSQLFLNWFIFCFRCFLDCLFEYILIVSQLFLICMLHAWTVCLSRRFLECVLNVCESFIICFLSVLSCLTYLCVSWTLLNWCVHAYYYCHNSFEICFKLFVCDSVVSTNASRLIFECMLIVSQMSIKFLYLLLLLVDVLTCVF